MSRIIKIFLSILGVIFLAGCLLSAALYYLVPTDRETEIRQESNEEMEVVAEVEATAEDEKPVTAEPTELPVRPPATATGAPGGPRVVDVDRIPVVSRTPTSQPTRTPRPTATPGPTRTPTPLPTPTILRTATPTQLPTATALPGEIATVIGIIDGDTIIVDLNGVTWRVRYIGIDTPESGQPCGSEATSANYALVNDKTIRMVKDVNETDRYGRLLRYVYVGDVFVNRELVADGWAEAVDYPPDTAMSSILHAAASEGVNRGCSLVAGAIPTVPPRAPVVPVVPIAPPTDPLPTSAPAPQPTAPPAAPVGNCHPSYPTVCIAPPPPDLDCGQIPHRRFQVVGDDPHNFDGDHDGIGCESG